MDNNLPKVDYTQGLSGKRWHLYAPWSRLLPVAFMDKWGARWSGRSLWQGEIVCGSKRVWLSVYGGSALDTAWQQKLDRDERSYLVPSVNLPAMPGSSLPLGRLLLAVCLRQALNEVSRELPAGTDHLSIGLIARSQEMACWLANLEGLARQITVFTERRSRLLPLAASGLAPRQLDISVTALGVDIIIVAPEYLSWLNDRNLTPGTIVIRTDGVVAAVKPGMRSMGISWDEQFLPAELIASEEDVPALSEALILAARFAGQPLGWPTNWSKRLLLLEKALEQSSWAYSWNLAGSSVVSAV